MKLFLRCFLLTTLFLRLDYNSTMVRTKKKLVNLVIIFLTILKLFFFFFCRWFFVDMSHRNTNTKVLTSPTSLKFWLFEDYKVIIIYLIFSRTLPLHKLNYLLNFFINSLFDEFLYKLFNTFFFCRKLFNTFTY